MKRYRVLTVFCLLFLAVVLSPKVHALGGAGTESDPYVLTSAADLAAMHSDLDAFYVLGADIDAAGYTLTPVGNELEGAFTGTLDGKGHTISNLTMNLPDTKFVGLFGYLEGTVTDLKLSDVSIIGGRCVGGIAGEAGVGSSITECTVLSGAVTSPGARISTNVGGIAGVCEGEISDCTNGAIIQAANRYAVLQTYAGGIVGCHMAETSIKNCANTGAVDGDGVIDSTLYIGGIIGRTGSPVMVDGCANSGPIGLGSSSNGAFYAGGVVGCASAPISLVRCDNRGKVDLPYQDVAGGMIGSALGRSTLRDCTNYVSIWSEKGYAGGMIGRAADSFLTNCRNYDAVYGGYAAGLVYANSSGSVVVSCENYGRILSSNAAYPLINLGKVSEDSRSVILGLGAIANVTLLVDESKTVLFTTAPSSNYIDELVWASSDESVVSVTQDGVITGQDFGAATVTVKTTGLGLSQSFTVTVAPTLTLDRTELTLEAGFAAQLTPVRTPACEDTYTWSSSNTSCATVDSSGRVTALKAGTAVITVRASSGLTATCTVCVAAPKVQAESVKLDQTLLRPVSGEKVQLTATVLPSGATDKTVTWESSAPGIASVNSDGLVEALAPGDAVITVRTANGLYDVCQVKVVHLSSAAFVVKDSRGERQSSIDTTVQLVKNPGIAAFTMEIQYDPSALTPAAVTAGELLSTGTLTSNINTAAADGKLRVTWYAAADAAGDGPAFTVTWQTTDLTGAFPIQLSFGDGDVCNAEQLEVRVGAESGTVYVLDRPVGDIYPDGLVNMKDIVYFARYFNEQETLDDGQRLAADLCYDGQIDVKDLTALAQVLSKALEDSGESQSAQIAATVSLMDLGDEEEPFEITIADAETAGEGAVVLRVTGANCGGLAALRFRVAAPEGFEVLSVQPSGLLEETGTFGFNRDTGIVTWYSGQDQILNGALFDLTLCAAGTADLPATVSLEYSANDFFSVDGYTNVPVRVKAGTISRPGYAAITGASLHDGKLAVEVDTNMTSQAILIVAVYQNGRVTNITSSTFLLAAGSYELPVSVSEGQKCRVFLLDGITYAPLSPPLEP